MKTAKKITLKKYTNYRRNKTTNKTKRSRKLTKKNKRYKSKSNPKSKSKSNPKSKSKSKSKSNPKSKSKSKSKSKHTQLMDGGGCGCSSNSSSSSFKNYMSDLKNTLNIDGKIRGGGYSVLPNKSILGYKPTIKSYDDINPPLLKDL
jgi:hypothetical protein